MPRNAKYHSRVFHGSVRDISHNWLRLELVEYVVILETEKVMLRDYSDWKYEDPPRVEEVRRLQGCGRGGVGRGAGPPLGLSACAGKTVGDKGTAQGPVVRGPMVSGFFVDSLISSPRGSLGATRPFPSMGVRILREELSSCQKNRNQEGQSRDSYYDSVVPP